MVKIHIMKNSLSFFVYESLLHVLRALLWEVWSHIFDFSTNARNGMGLPMSWFQPLVRECYFFKRSILSHVSSMLSAIENKNSQNMVCISISVCIGGKWCWCYYTPLLRNPQQSAWWNCLAGAINNGKSTGNELLAQTLYLQAVLSKCIWYLRK